MNIDDFYTEREQLGVGTMLSRPSSNIMIIVAVAENSNVLTVVDASTGEAFSEASVEVADRTDIVGAEMSMLLNDTPLQTWDSV